MSYRSESELNPNQSNDEFVGMGFMSSGEAAQRLGQRSRIGRARKRRGESWGHALSHRRQDESGAIIILALVFLVSVSLIVIALLGWVGTSLTASAGYSDERATE